MKLQQFFPIFSPNNSLPKKVYNRSLGFTLLELLVVISIIGILIGLSTVSYTTAQLKGRNAKRRGDMKAAASALEQYYSASSSSYSISDNTNCSTQLAVGSDYMPAGRPTDPKSPTLAYTWDCDISAYCICAQLEPADATDGNASDNSCTFSGSPKSFFCVKNQQ